MQQQPAFGFEQLTTEIIRGVLEAVAERGGESEAQRFARHQTTVFSVMAFLPRDAVETMLAGQCVIFDHLLRDGARDLLRGQAEQIKLRARPQIVATGNAFLRHLTQITRLQTRPVEQVAVLPRTAKPETPAAPPKPAQPAAANAARTAPPDPRHARLAAMLPGFGSIPTAPPLVSGAALTAVARKPADAVVATAPNDPRGIRGRPIPA
jgi:hypothetical protein